MNSVITLAGIVLKELIRRKDFYLILALLLIIIFYSASISFGGESGFVRYFKEIGISFTYIFSVIIGITFASRQIPQEVESKTIYSLLAHPVSRGKFIMGKFLGVFFTAVVSFSLFYSVFIASIFIRGDFSTRPLLLLEGYVLHIFLLSFFVAFTIFLSLFLSTAANSMIALIIYFATDWFGVTAPAYILLPHPELFDIRDKIIHSQDIVPGWAVSFLFIYAIIYTVIFLNLTYLIFRRRNL